MYTGHGDCQKIDKERGRVLMEAASATGLPLAEAYCRYRGWGGFAPDQDNGYAVFKRIAEEVGFVHEDDMMTIGAAPTPETKEELQEWLVAWQQGDKETHGHPNGWNVSKITDMEALFCTVPPGTVDDSDMNKSKFKNGELKEFNADISAWDTSNVVTMKRMFHSCASFNQPLGAWNTGNVTTMERMFMYATSFDQPLGGWNTSNVTDMSDMFYNATSFDQPLGGWNTSNVTTMEGMFCGATSFNHPLGGWNTSNVTDMSCMFYFCASFDQPLGGWNTSNVTGMAGMFYGANSFDQPLGGWNMSNVYVTQNMFYCSAMSLSNKPPGITGDESITGVDESADSD